MGRPYIARMVHVGIGYDVHQLIAGRKLILGGVEIPHTKGLDGHSDADVLLQQLQRNKKSFEIRIVPPENNIN